MEDIIELPCENNEDEEANNIGLEMEVGEIGILDPPIDDATEIEEGQLVSKIEGATDTVVSGFVASSSEIVNCAPIDEKFDVDTPSENGCLIDRDVSPRTVSDSKSGAKRLRTTFDEQQPSVHVKYYCLSRQSKQKLEELLRQWSEWHVQNPFETLDQNGGAETGDGIYFPALDIGIEKTSAVSFWMENETRKPENNDSMHLEDGSVPLYDRGFALGSSDGSSNLEGGLELLDAPRCFNCGSYSHALKECPKPRNNAAVNSSRKQLKSKRNQTAGMRNAARYYQDTPGGKYEGLRPGVLEAETRRLLGLGEFYPPPWLNRMRDIGYPPGYLEPEDEDLPSGIIIYADEEIKDDKEEGEILEAERVEAPRKKSVLFPGINAPIPKNGDEKVWAAGSSNHDRHRNGNFHSNYSSESNSRGRSREHNNSRDCKDDDLSGFERASRYQPRYSELDYSSPLHNLRRNASGSRSPNAGRSMVDRVRNDPLDSEDSLVSRLYSSYSYNSIGRISELSNTLDDRVDQPDYSSRGRNRDDRYHHRRVR